jgi:hypothetical protein
MPAQLPRCSRVNGENVTVEFDRLIKIVSRQPADPG